MQGTEKNEEQLLIVMDFIFLHDENIVKLIVVMVAQLHEHTKNQ
jgi:hypothetical protein